ncbi:hypothetical protein FIBSPDRAFT_1037968 [Athelia psychrophila]|uniref:MYND-type domain-containing protein n=1 Tax=Athelia psychrophila TaxID=1759441 RepID=A0A166TK59_9AGAM|nr:hypothetical protein FIBSPDRAFT_1037968 [Fibularhizoctonia sp. CBS 109695]
MPSQFGLILTLIPQCHQALSAPKAWNDAYERLLSNKSEINAHHYFDSCALEIRNKSKQAQQDQLEEYADLIMSLRGLQFDVVVENVTFAQKYDLSLKWLAATPAEREPHVLSGLSRACSISPNLNKARMSCYTELRLSYLRDNGQNMLDLLTAITPDSLSNLPAEPSYVSNKDWDAVSAAHRDSQDDMDKIALAYILALRNKLITYTIQIIIRSFLGLELPKTTLTKPSRLRDKALSPLEMAEQEQARAYYGEKEAKTLDKEAKAAWKERNSNKVRICTKCSTPETVGEVFKRCPSCFKISREVLYCSAKCQKEDWKVRHKAVCGKELDLDAAHHLGISTSDIPRAAPNAIIGPPSKGFKRPIELLQQISLLEKHPQGDYAVYRSVYQNNENTGLMAYHPSVAARFRTRRNYAMTTGDQESVAYICEHILWDIEMRGAKDFVTEKVIQQLSREYAFPGLAQALLRLKVIRDKHPRQWPHLQYAA